MSKQEKKQSFLGGVATLTMAVFAVKVIGALYKIPLGNVLGTEGMTHFNAAYKIYSFLLSLSTAGLPLALSKLTAEARALGRRNQSRALLRVALCLFAVIGTVGTALMFFQAEALAGMMNNSLAYWPIRALSLSVVCVCIMSAFRGYTQGCENMVPSATSQIIEAIFKLLVGLTLAWYWISLGFGVEIGAAGAILGVTVSTVLAMGYMIFHHVRHQREPASADVPDKDSVLLGRILSIGIPITLGASGMSLLTLIDQSLVMGRLQTVLGLTEEAAAALNGEYEFGMTLFNLPSSFIPPVTMCLIPFVSAALARKDHAQTAKLVSSSLRLTMLLALPAGVGLSVLSGPILQMLYPAQAESAAAAAYHLRILGLASVFVCIMLLTNGILQAYNRARIPVLTLLVGGVCKIVMNYILVGNPDIHIKGAPISTLCCYLIIAGLNLYFVWKYSPEKPRYFSVLLKPALASAVMGGAVWAVYGFAGRALSGHSAYGANALATLVSILAGVVVYFILVLALQILRADDVRSIPKGAWLIRKLHLK
ncbi:MAG: polysaccharide biosynthesis protein [Ruminococcaceae bacterium]|nr:polysaccharide biosynthesis protein [Oscillospiraceae bacterium]